MKRFRPDTHQGSPVVTTSAFSASPNKLSAEDNNLNNPFNSANAGIKDLPTPTLAQSPGAAPLKGGPPASGGNGHLTLQNNMNGQMMNQDQGNMGGHNNMGGHTPNNNMNQGGNMGGSGGGYGNNHMGGGGKGGGYGYNNNMGGGGGGHGSGGMGNQISYAEVIKTGQRSSTNFKNAWHQFCEQNNQAMYDPNKHDQSFIQQFLDHMGKAFLNSHGMPSSAQGQAPPAITPITGASGGRYGSEGQSPANGYNADGGGKGKGKFRSNVQVDGSLGRVIELVKQGQRNSQDWKTLWIDWCQENGNGIHDPTRHSACFIIAFVLKYGLAEVVSAPWASPYLVSLGELAKPYMVATIKKGQSMSEVWKEQWGLFADSKANGTRDPQRHDAGSLMEFFDTIALQQFGNEAWMQPYVTGSEPQY
ncbi:unnamed protein product [Amoebophrya sp. A25]|nr:unnamed protein product [Amoebophrya sp. A25]|eukprot:GSA25T00006568001.1